MECEQVKKEHPELKIRCCNSCHEDDAMGYGEDLWFEIDGVERHVCCAVNRAVNPHD
jgi:hypothetical protein